jgi:Protein kinase domain/PEGA domain/Tetratricopeptide repeat
VPKKDVHGRAERDRDHLLQSPILQPADAAVRRSDGMGVTSRSDGANKVAAGVLTLGLLAAAPAAAQEWHEAYRSGLTALARGDATRAVESLRRAVALRPEPGRNVVTYGTNVEPRYFPYLRLAEAYLALGQFEPARQALDTSAKWGIEPAEEREKLVARIEAWVEQQRPHPPPSIATPAPATTVPLPTPTPAASPETPVPATRSPPPTPGPAAKSTPSPASRSAQAPTTPEAKAPITGPGGVHPPPVTSPAESATGGLELVSQPGGAFAYVDDEPIGSTDPETGRLLKTELAPGRHRVRVAREGHVDVVRDIEVPRGGRAAFYAALQPVSDPRAGDRGPLLALGAVVILVVAALAWMVLRRPEESPRSIWSPTPRSPRTGIRSGRTPSGPPTPGARRDDLGQEWFGDYRLLELLGRGGMASVYKAERRGELSALKRPLASFLDDPQFMERFLREAEIGRTLNHPSIARILERGEVERVPYFTMELLAGQTLEAYIRGWGAAEPRTAASIMVQVGEALDFAHSKGVVHRDLKPSNIMMLPDGTAKVMDFGIARARRFDGLTATGAFLGTPDYVAPEMIEGRGTEPRSDLYAVGVILFELLTGKLPFSGETPFEIFKKHCSEEPPPPSRIQRGVPAELDELVLRLLRKDPALRPASAEELVVALRDWLNRAA